MTIGDFRKETEGMSDDIELTVIVTVAADKDMTAIYFEVDKVWADDSGELEEHTACVVAGRPKSVG